MCKGILPQFVNEMKNLANSLPVFVIAVTHLPGAKNIDQLLLLF
jgi:hypothetical protein